MSVLFSSISLVAQNSCNIIVPFEPELVQASRAVNKAEQTDHFLATASWDSLDNGLVHDQKYLSIQLDPYDRSNTLHLSNFNFNLPSESVIHGLRMSFVGTTQGDGEISEMQMQFTNSSGPVGNDISNQPALLGTEWPHDTIGYNKWWKYGYQSDLWGKTWTAEEVNSEAFGIILRIENQTDDEVLALLDQVMISVYYTPPYNTCVHDCIVFSTELIDGVDNFNWEFPSNFEMIYSPVNQHILNLVSEDNTQGTYQVCVTPEGQSKCCRDFIVGSCALGSIGNLVWKDSNLNGIVDNNEQGISNVRVAIYNESGVWLDDQLTDASGNYLFTDLKAGIYRLKTEQPYEDCEISLVDNFTGDNNSNYFPAYGSTSSDYITLDEGENITDVDFGWAPRAGNIKGYVWRDSNGNSLDDNEIRLTWIEINLYSCDGTLVSTVLSDEQGNYCLEDVNIGSYYIGIDFFTSSTASIGLDSDISNSNNENSWTTDCFEIIPGDSIFTNFGFIPYGSIGDYVFNDENNDGLQDTTDWPIEGVMLSLIDGTGMQVSTTVTNADGYYIFDKIPSGPYCVISNYPDVTYTPSIPTAGVDDAIDSDGNDIGNNQVKSGTINLLDGADITNIDFGFVKRSATINGRYVLDSNGDGVLLGEGGVEGAQVQFFDCVGPSLVATRTTDANGEFDFTGFVGSSYFLVFDTNVDGIQISGNSSDIDNSMAIGSTPCFPIVDETTQSYFGVVVPTSIVGNRVWEDVNRNGLQDNGEPGIPNIDIRLFNGANDLIGMTLTNADGLYTFNDIFPDPSCQLELIVPSGFVSTPADQGTNDEIDSDGFESNGMVRSASFPLSNGLITMDMDFGFTRMGGTIAGQIWIDGNGNLSFDNELSAEGFMVHLRTCDGNTIATMPSNADGIYIFNDVVPGDYYVSIDLPSNYSHAAGGDSQTTNAIEIGGTDCITINDLDQINLIQGIIPHSNIGDFVWDDINKNGIQDTGEPGIANLSVNLFDRNNTLLETGTTSVDGLYVFTNYPASDYLIEINTPDGFQGTINNAGSFDTDSDGIDMGALVSSSIIELRDGINNTSIDFGFTLIGGSISGQIWIDGNGNLSFDNELSAEGFIVHLKTCDGNTIATTPSNADGIYTFNDIALGNYYISIDLPSNYSHASGGDSQTTNAIEVGSTDCITLNDSDQINLMQGIIPHSNIGDFVWNDINKNGTQDAGEPGIANLSVNLFDRNNTLLETVNTSVDGLYVFNNYPASDYLIEINIPTGFEATSNNAGSFDTDSDGIDMGNSVNSSIIELRDGANNTSIDFGFFEEEIIIVPTGSVSGIIWNDGNGNNIKDLEIGYPDVEVSLFDCNSQMIVTTTTSGSDGTYSFNDLAAGLYAIILSIQPDEAFSIGGNSQITNANGIGSTDCTILIDGGNLELNAGIIPLSNISGRIWLDENSDGIEDISETGFEGIEVSLFTEAGDLVNQGSSEINGTYRFNSVRPGLYYVQLSFPPGAFGLTAANVTTPDVDSEGSVINGFIISDPMDLADGIDLQDRDFGLIEITPEANITGNYLRDQNGDTNIATDPGIPDAEITLLSCIDGSVIASTFTDVNGAFIFSNVEPGEYYIVFPEMEDFDLLEEGQSDITSILAAGATDCFTVLDDLGANITGAAIPLSILGDFVWEDIDENGIQDIDEPGLAGIEVFLFDQSTDLIGQTISSNDGEYNFEDVPPGNYYAEVNIQDYEISPFEASSDDSENSDLTMINGVATSKPVLLFDGDDYLDLDFGLIKAEVDTSDNSDNLISGFVFEDLDGNGINDGSDILTDDLEVSLFDFNGTLIEVVNSKNGAYEFTGFPNGVYYVQFNLPNETSPSPSGIGNDPLNDSDVTNFTDGQTENLDFQSGGSMIGINVGYYFFAAVGNYIWFDSNEDGIQDNDEDGANNYIIRLWNDAGTPLAMQTSRVNPLSNEPGFYFFDNLAPGDYYISTTISFGTSFTSPNQGNESLDSNIDGSNGAGTSATFSVSSGQQKNDIDIGLLTTPGSVGDLVWIDSNGDGIFNNDEQGINNIQIELYTENGDLTDSTTTQDDNGGNPGYYEFTDVQVGNYYIVVELPGAFLATAPFKGGNSSEDSDITGNIVPGSSNIFSVGSGVFSDDIDCGIYEPGVLGDYVWLDEDNDGMQEFGEFGIEDVEVILFKVGEGPVDNKVTGNDGLYTFDDIRPGSYYIEVIPPSGFQLTQSNAGTSEALDSDADLTGLTSQFDIVQGTTNTEVDFGLVPANATISGRAWLDDGNGLQDTDEESLQFIEVRLLDDSMNEVDNMLTNALGNYAFINLSPGNYFIKYDAVPQHIFTLQDATFNDTEDSDSDENGITDVLNIATGTTQISNVDVGYVFTGGPILKPASFPQFQINYFPTPAKNMINIEFTKYDDADVSIQIFDMGGNFLSSRNYGNLPQGDQILKYPLNGLANGNYLILVDLGKSRQSNIITIFN